MKIQIPKGANIYDALDNLKEYLKNNAPGYDKLKSQMNIYLTLIDDDRKVCPLNEGNIILRGNEIIDIEHENTENAMAYCMEKVYRHISNMQNNIHVVEEKLNKAKRNYEKAVEKGYSTAEKWKKELDDLENRKDNICPMLIEKAENALLAIEKGKTIWDISSHYQKSKYSVYQISVRPRFDSECLFFEKPLMFYDSFFSHEDLSEREWVYIYLK